MDKCVLSKIKTKEQFELYHELRNRMLFRRFGRPYTKYHHDETKKNDYRRVLLLNGKVIGTIRIDIENNCAKFRLVTIREDKQKNGFGIKLVNLSEEFAKAHQCDRIEVNAAKESIGFWIKAGYIPVDTNHPKIMRKHIKNKK